LLNQLIEAPYAGMVTTVGATVYVMRRKSLWERVI
jgi:hypothetical protein